MLLLPCYEVLRIIQNHIMCPQCGGMLVSKTIE